MKITRNHYIAKIIFVLLLCFFLSAALLINPTISFVIILGCVYLWLLLVLPEIAMVLVFFVIFNGFGFLREDFLRMPYLFRLRDIMLISSFLPLFHGIYRKDDVACRVFHSPLAKTVWLILGLTVMQLFLTKLRYPQESLGSFFRVGRQYLYYSLYFPGLYILADDRRFKRFVVLCFVVVLLFCLLFVLQFMLGTGHKIFPYGNVVSQDIEGASFARVYLGGIAVPALLMSVSFFLCVFTNKKNWLMTATLYLTSAQTFLTFYRAHTIGSLAGLLGGVLLIRDKTKWRRLFFMGLSLLLILSLSVFAFKVIAPGQRNAFDAVASRLMSASSGITDRKGTFYFRWKESFGQIELIKQNPILGAGLIHDESDLFARYRIGKVRTMIRAGESGILTLVFDLGLMGFFWFMFMSKVFLTNAKRIYKKHPSEIMGLLALGLFSFYLGRMVSFIIEPAFVGYTSITLIVIAMIFLDCLYIRESKND